MTRSLKKVCLLWIVLWFLNSLYGWPLVWTAGLGAKNSSLLTSLWVCLLVWVMVFVCLSAIKTFSELRDLKVRLSVSVFYPSRYSSIKVMYSHVALWLDWINGLQSLAIGGMHCSSIKQLDSVEHCTQWSIKRCHFIMDCNFCVSWLIFTILVPVETGMNALQYTYLVVLNRLMASYLRRIERHESLP